MDADKIEKWRAERDLRERLAQRVEQLPHYGIKHPEDRLISRDEVVNILREGIGD